MKQLILSILLLSTTTFAWAQNSSSSTSDTIVPRSYDCHYTSTPIVVDGDINDKAWQNAQWTENFVDIRGYDFLPAPIFRTRAKILYDKEYLYLAFEMEEPHLWGTIKERDETIYWDNDIEVFIDADGDCRNYQEYEFNVLGTEWDLMLTEPQARGGIHINNYNLVGMKTAVKAYGTINNPNDKDEKWTFEMAMPIDGIQQSSYNKNVPLVDQTWRINFSRVEWLKYEIKDGKYQKLPGTNGFGHEENWVWSPTGAVDMHRPEKWGYLKFLPQSTK